MKTLKLSILIPGALLSAALATAEAPVASAPGVSAESAAEMEPDAADEPEEEAASAAEVFEDGLSAREIYELVLKNRFDSSLQTLALHSYDRAENVSLLRARVAWAHYDETTEERIERKITSRTMIKYMHPRDVRGTGYLVINKLDLPDDQFVYLPSMRRVRRINLRTETVAGTDFAVEDIVPREIDDATYHRIPDTELDGTPCYAIEARPSPDIESSYSKFVLLIEKEHYVPLRTHYWNAAELEIKQLDVDASTIEQIDGVWLPRRSTMRQWVDGTRTELNVVEIETNPDLPPRVFSQRTLESRKID